MTRAIHRMTSGRLRVWCMSHGQQFRLAIALVFLVLAFGLAGKWDYEDALEQARADKRAVAETLRQERAAKSLPRVAWVIESSDPGVNASMAEIAGALDGERARLAARRVK